MGFNSQNWTRPTSNDNSRTIIGLASTPYLLNQAGPSSLRQRMGDLIQSMASDATSEVAGVWDPIYDDNYKTRNNNRLAKADMDYYGMQLGGDWNTLGNNKDRNYLGVFIGQTTGKPDYDRGHATANSFYGGLYDTYIVGNGWYIDSVVKLGHYRNKYHLRDSQDNASNGEGHSIIFTLSAQMGKRFIFTENDKYSVYAEPQSQLNYSRLDSFKTTASLVYKLNKVIATQPLYD